MRLILASSSPRRAELLRNAGIDFEVRPSGVDEIPELGETPETFARRAAREKALAVAAAAGSERPVLGADTVVDANGEILGKPAGPWDATRMLRLLSGTTHRVITAVCLVRPPNRIEALKHEITWVTLRALDDEEIRAYVASSEPLGKAGAYAIQGLACKFVTRLDGCYFNVVGLPVALVYEILKPWAKEPRLLGSG